VKTLKDFPFHVDHKVLYKQKKHVLHHFLLVYLAEFSAKKNLRKFICVLRVLIGEKIFKESKSMVVSE